MYHSTEQNGSCRGKCFKLGALSLGTLYEKHPGTFTRKKNGHFRTSKFSQVQLAMKSNCFGSGGMWGGITKFVLYTSGCNNSSHVNCNWCEWHRVRKKMFLHYAIPPHTMTERVGYRWLGDFKRRSGGIIFSWSQMHSNLWTYMTPHAVEKCVMSKIKRKTCFTIAFDFHFHTLPINPCLKTELIGPISDWYFS